jgi:hypothetical protein
MENPWIIINKTHGWVHWKDNSRIEITKFAMCGLYFFVHVVEYIITIVKTFIIVAKTTMLSSIDECNQNWMTLFTFHLIFLIFVLSFLIHNQLWLNLHVDDCATLVYIIEQKWKKHCSILFKTYLITRFEMRTKSILFGTTLAMWIVICTTQALRCVVNT